MKFNIVVSINNHNLIGENDKLLIHSKKDLRNFQKIQQTNTLKRNKILLLWVIILGLVSPKIKDLLRKE